MCVYTENNIPSARQKITSNIFVKYVLILVGEQELGN